MTPGRPRAGLHLHLWLMLAAVGVTLIGALSLAWTCDDAFISFRYARQLVQGHGLVFNAGERVEGYTNFLWTLWCALGIAAGADLELWARLLSVASALATVGLLGLLHHRLHHLPAARRGFDLSLPLAAIAAATHRELLIWATGGLETALHTALLTAAFAVLVLRPPAPRRALAAGSLLGVAVLVRPDVPLVAGILGLYLLVMGWFHLGSRQLDKHQAGLDKSHDHPAGSDLPPCLDKQQVGVYQDTRLAGKAGSASASASASSSSSASASSSSSASASASSSLLAFSLAFAIPWLAHLAFRWHYYGELVPNTAYAKSAARSWWSQGAVYVGLYVQRYPLLALGPLLFGRRALRGGRAALSSRPDLALAPALAGTYTLYVARVGGDFMFGRFLVPITPLLLWSLHGELHELLGDRPCRMGVATLLVVAAQLGLPATVPAGEVVHGVADEWSYYHARPRELGGATVGESMRATGRTLRPYLTGLPVRILIIGSQAQLAWESRAHTVIEANGLTDATIAHRPLEHRGRPGHEKHPTFDYLVRHRAVHLAFSPAVVPILRGRIPLIPARFGEVRGVLLTWDNALVTALRARGAEIPDYLGMLDKLIAGLPQMSPRQVAAAWTQHEPYYFAHNHDPVRRAAFMGYLPGGAE